MIRWNILFLEWNFGQHRKFGHFWHLATQKVVCAEEYIIWSVVWNFIRRIYNLSVVENFIRRIYNLVCCWKLYGMFSPPASTRLIRGSTAQPSCVGGEGRSYGGEGWKRGERGGKGKEEMWKEGIGALKQISKVWKTPFRNITVTSWN